MTKNNNKDKIYLKELKLFSAGIAETINELERRNDNNLKIIKINKQRIILAKRQLRDCHKEIALLQKKSKK